MLENLIKLSLGEKIDTEVKFKKWSCVQFLNDENYYRCLEFIQTGDKHIRVNEVGEYKDSVIKSSLDRLGYVILQADTKKEIEDILKKIK